MAQEAAVNPNTMQRALAKMEEDGLLVTHRTTGRTITEDGDMIKRAKTRMVEKQISEFLTKMQQMGFDQKEVLCIINDMLGGSK